MERISRPLSYLPSRPVDNLSFTIYKNGTHDAWTKTYNNQKVWDWILAQKLTVTGNRVASRTGIRLYPNPTADVIHIISPGDMEKEVRIF